MNLSRARLSVSPSPTCTALLCSSTRILLPIGLCIRHCLLVGLEPPLLLDNPRICDSFRKILCTGSLRAVVRVYQPSCFAKTVSTSFIFPLINTLYRMVRVALSFGAMFAVQGMYKKQTHTSTEAHNDNNRCFCCCDIPLFPRL